MCVNRRDDHAEPCIKPVVQNLHRRCTHLKNKISLNGCNEYWLDEYHNCSRLQELSAIMILYAGILNILKKKVPIAPAASRVSTSC